MTYSTPTDRNRRGLTPSRIKSRKPVAVVVTVLLLGIGGVAFAYWTNSGSGSGTGATGTNAAVTINQTSTVANLQPGGAPQALSGNFNNPNSGPVYVNTVTVAVGTVTKAPGAATGTCDATDYVIVGSPMTVAAQVPAGNAVGAFSGATVAFNNKATNQDACKNATLTFTYTSN